MTEKDKFQRVVSKFTSASSWLEDCKGDIINYRANVPGYIDSIIDDVEKHLDEILKEAKIIAPLCKEARKRYEKINNL